MKISQHAKNSKKVCGEKGVDIHKWIDSFFNKRKFWLVNFTGDRSIYNPYSHRKNRHYKEAVSDAIEQFKHKYPEEIIKAVFFQHLLDDYGGYIPSKSDHEDPDFIKKYHKW